MQLANASATAASRRAATRAAATPLRRCEVRSEEDCGEDRDARRQADHGFAPSSFATPPVAFALGLSGSNHGHRIGGRKQFAVDGLADHLNGDRVVIDASNDLGPCRGSPITESLRHLQHPGIVVPRYGSLPERAVRMKDPRADLSVQRIPANDLRPLPFLFRELGG